MSTLQHSQIIRRAREPVSGQMQALFLLMGRERECLVPDFKVLGGTLWKMDKLAELKVITCGLYHYPEGVSGKAVERRAAPGPRTQRQQVKHREREPQVPDAPLQTPEPVSGRGT